MSEIKQKSLRAEPLINAYICLGVLPITSSSPSDSSLPLFLPKRTHQSISTLKHGE